MGILNWQLVNAFTLPGGEVLVTRGLIDRVESPAELAGVLAHEFEHVRQRHVMAHVIRGSILSFAWAVTIGDFSGLFVVDPSTMFAIANQRFSRDDETAADAGALARLDAAGITREGFAAFFKRLEKETDVLPAWLGSHPASKTRIEAIAAAPPGRPARAAGPEEALSAADWQSLKGACAGQEPEPDPLRALLKRRSHR